MEENKYKFPTEIVELPSKGLLYSEDNLLSSGKIEMKYMTAKEEDILTNQNYIRQGTVIDKLLQSMIVSKINYDDLLVADKDAIMVSARILGYGKDYVFTYNGEEVTVDLTTMKEKLLDESLVKTPRVNEFHFTLPHSGNEISFRLLTHGDDKKIEQELDGLKKIDPKGNPELSTRLKHMILSVNGNREKKDIREFVDNAFLARDSRAFREYVSKLAPGVELKFNYVSDSNVEEGVTLPIGLNFFWPDSGI
jgi:hypothetical protein